MQPSSTYQRYSWGFCYHLTLLNSYPYLSIPIQFHLSSHLSSKWRISGSSKPGYPTQILIQNEVLAKQMVSTETLANEQYDQVQEHLGFVDPRTNLTNHQSIQHHIYHHFTLFAGCLCLKHIQYYIVWLADCFEVLMVPIRR